MAEGTNKFFEFNDDDALGRLNSVDTGKVEIEISDDEKLKTLQVNRLVALHSPQAGNFLIGMVTKILRTQKQRPSSNSLLPQNEDNFIEVNSAEVSLVGTFMRTHEGKANVFLRSLQTVPSIDACCFRIEGDDLTQFMASVAVSTEGGSQLEIGTYSLGENAKALLNGDRFFQRHALIVGSTGSGKSWATAHMLEQISQLPNANAILLDLHGEYGPIQGNGIQHFKVAGPQDLTTEENDSSILYLPYWLLSSEAMLSLFVDRSDQNAPNQAMIMDREIVRLKGESVGDNEIFTIDSPLPFNIKCLLEELERLDIEMVPSAKAGTEKQGLYHGKLSRLIQRLANKHKDRRLRFLFNVDHTLEKKWLSGFCGLLFSSNEDKPGIKIIDFSEVPSDILPLAVSLLAQIGFAIQQWTPQKKRHPIALLCDEAHLYMPDNPKVDSAQLTSLNIFERIAKEGRKYGLALVVISQRPSEVNRTVLSQCNNFVVMRLTNESDQEIIQRLLPESIGKIPDVLPVLDIGEALVVGDACMLPTRIRISRPQNKPESGSMDFWAEWSKPQRDEAVGEAVANWLRQSSR